LAQNIHHYRQKKSGFVIVGRGMVAGALKELSGWDEDILFSSGVSNSGEQSERVFQRESEMVKFYIDRAPSKCTFVYFSTTSIFDATKSGSPYVNHKIRIEKQIRDSDVKHLIIRLPNLVGFSNNPNTLTNFFADKIKMHRAIKLNFHAIRHLIDVNDLPQILNGIKEKHGKDNVTVNVETDKPLTADKILAMLEVILRTKADIRYIEAKPVTTINNEELKTTSLSYQLKTNDDYHYHLLKKYYSA
jgi:nucleoside-diphosphate-sugar epimerase